MLKHLDGFDAYGSTQLGQQYAASGSVAVAAAGRLGGGNSCRFTDTGTLAKVIGGTEATVRSGFAYKRDRAGANQPFFGMFEGTTPHIYLYMTTLNTVEVRRGDGTLLGTLPTAYPINTFWHFQVGVTVHDTLGEVEVKVNSVTVLHLTGIDTRNGGTGYISMVELMGFFSHVGDFDDWWIADTTGAANTGFLGDARCEVIYPTGAGATTDWTPSTGANWQNVDETPVNSDTDYNSSATPGNIDTFVTGDLASASGTVLGVQHLLYARKDDAGARTIRPVSRIGGVNYPGATSGGLTTSYLYENSIEEVSPASAAAWTVSEINASEFGYELVT